MAEGIAAPRPRLIPLFFSAVCIGAAGFLLPPPEGLDPASLSYLFSSFLAFTGGLIRIYVAVSGVPLRPVDAQRLTQVVAAASIAALLLAPPPSRLQPAGTPAPVHDLVPGRPEPLFMCKLSPVGSPEAAKNTIVGHPESLFVSTVPSGGRLEAVTDRVTGSPLPSFVANASTGNNEATEDRRAVCAVPSWTPCPVLQEGKQGEGLKRPSLKN